MDAIMAVLAATLLANADGRYGRLLSELINARTNRRATVLLFFAAFLALAMISAIAAQLASMQLGLGVLNLFAAMALASAAGALLWRGRGMPDAAPLIAASHPLLFARLLLVQIGDRNQFLLFGLGALSGAAPWGVAGGLVGILVAMLPLLGFGPAMLERHGARMLRWAAAAALLLWATVHARAAFGV